MGIQSGLETTFMSTDPDRPDNRQPCHIQNVVQDLVNAEQT